MLAVILALTSLWSGNIHSISQKRHTCTGFHLRYQWHILRSHIISGTHEAHSRVIVQFSSVTQSCPTLCDPMNRSRPGLPVHHQLSEFTQTQSIESVMPSSHLILGRPLLLLPPIPPSIRVFSNESTLRMRWPKYWSFSFSISPSNEHPGQISFRMDWLDPLIAVCNSLL